jgi:tRNA dimethylallyltransferase
LNNSILAIVGPTASGKTDLGLRLAKEQNGEIISVDSRQVYRYLSVGTAKPTDTRGIPYHLIDFLEPSQSFSAADFVRLATDKVNEIRRRGKTPIFVGGTGLYYKALTEGLAELPTADSKTRERLIKESRDEGREKLHQRLQKIDPEAAAKIPFNNIQRLVRALEVYELTGKPISVWHKEHQARPSSDALRLKFMGIDLPRAELVHRIEARCRTMLQQGMIEETQALVDKGFAENCPALTGLGYTRVIATLKGTLSQSDCLKLLIQDTRQYAKRQMTWFRHQLPVVWNK